MRGKVQKDVVPGYWRDRGGTTENDQEEAAGVGGGPGRVITITDTLLVAHKHRLQINFKSTKQHVSRGIPHTGSSIG